MSIALNNHVRRLEHLLNDFSIRLARVEHAQAVTSVNPEFSDQITKLKDEIQGLKMRMGKIREPA